MKNKVLCMLGLFTALSISSMGQTEIISDDFEEGAVSKVAGRFRGADFDLGWFANLNNVPSEWMIMDGTLQNSATNNGAYPDYMSAEGAVVRAISSSADTNNNIDISFDYDVSTNDTLYLHLWAYIYTGDSISTVGNVANFQSRTTLGDSTGDYPDLTSYVLLSSVQVTGTGTYTNSINIEGLLIDDVGIVGDFDYIQIAFAKSEDGELGTTHVDNLSITSSYEAPPEIPDPGFVGSPIFPEQSVLASQKETEQATGINFTGAAGNILGQSFVFDTEQSLAAISFQKSGDLVVPLGGTHELSLWIGEYDSMMEPTNHVIGATVYEEIFDLAGNTFIDLAWYSINLQSNLTLAAGTEYAYQLSWTSSDAAHTFTIFRKFEGLGGTDYYPDGTIIYQGGADGTLPMQSLINEPENDMAFALHSVAVTPESFLSVDPSELSMVVLETESTSDDLVEVTYNSSTNMELNISFSEETHPGSFSAVGGTNQILMLPFPESNEVVFQFDKTVHGLVGGDIATGIVTIAWNEVGGGDSGTVQLPVSGVVTYSPGQANSWSGGGDGASWGDAVNWSLGRVPGALAEDAASISGGATVTVSSDFSGVFPWDNVLDGGSTLNINADLMGGGDLTVGFSGDGFVNQAAGATSVGALTVTTTDSAINLMGGSLLVEDASVIDGAIEINGGTLTVDNADASMSFTGNGSITVLGGTFETTATIAQRSTHFFQDVQISGGTVNIGSQHFWRNRCTIIGDKADITMKYLNSNLSNTGYMDFIMGANGISSVKSPNGWTNLGGITLSVDGSAYTAGSGEFLLFDLNNFASTSTAITVTGFPDDVNAYVTQDQETDEVKLIIEWPGYDGWTGQYGLYGADAAKDADYDEDGADNFYEYALGGDPTNAAVQGYKAEFAVVDDGGTDYFMYVSPRRIGTEEYTGLLYEVQASTALSYGWSAAGVEELGVGPLDAEYEAVTNRVDMTGTSETFMRLYVEEL